MNKCAELSGERKVVSVHLCLCVLVCMSMCSTVSHIHTTSLSTFDDMECGEIAALCVMDTERL